MLLVLSIVMLLIILGLLFWYSRTYGDTFIGNITPDEAYIIGLHKNVSEREKKWNEAHSLTNLVDI